MQDFTDAAGRWDCLLQYRSCSRELLSECLEWCNNGDNHTLHQTSILAEALINGKLAKAFRDAAKDFVDATSITAGLNNSVCEVETHVNKMPVEALMIRE